MINKSHICALDLLSSPIKNFRKKKTHQEYIDEKEETNMHIQKQGTILKYK